MVQCNIKHKEPLSTPPTMNDALKYKIVSLVLAIGLLASLIHLVVSQKQATQPEHKPAAEIVMQNILSRKSVRSYTNRPVSRAQLDTLVRAAMAAPTGMDTRPWKFVIIDDKNAMQQLAAKLPRAKMLAEAQAAIAVCGDMSVLSKDGKPSRNWMLDCSAATENLLLQAEAMGLGAVWTAGYPYPDRLEAIKSALSLPDHIIPLNLIPIGYPKGDPQPKDKYNKNNIHYNKW